MSKSINNTSFSEMTSKKIVIQELRALPSSAEWLLGQAYYLKQGNKAFRGDGKGQVPYVVNNDGQLSRKTAELFFRHLEASQDFRRSEEPLYVLEFGIGVGLFARFFLDQLRAICAENNRNYYDRLCYIAADRSEQMLSDACRHGIFTNHSGHCQFRVVDACNPISGLGGEFSNTLTGQKPFCAVFLNYVLDCLPAAILETGGALLRQLCVRTCLAKNVELSDHTDMSIEDVILLANSNDPALVEQLRSIYHLFFSEFEFQDAKPDEILYSSLVTQCSDSRSRRVLHNFGAIQCLERLMPLVQDNGFIMINDYGITQPTSEQEEYEHQRFADSTAIGLNFPLLKQCLPKLGLFDWVEPAEDCENIYSRLVGKSIPPEVADHFRSLFAKSEFIRAAWPANQARTYVKQGRFELASSAYKEALRLQPWNWALISEATKHFNFGLRDPQTSLSLCRLALVLNPTCSVGLWNDLGDSLFLIGQVDEARRAFLQGLQIGSNDIRSCYNLVCVLIKEKNYPAALALIAEGIAFDKSKSYWEGFLKLQSDVLELLAKRRNEEELMRVNRVTKPFDASNMPQFLDSLENAVTEIKQPSGNPNQPAIFRIHSPTTDDQNHPGLEDS